MAQVSPGTNYTVQPGDSLFSIAQQAYGDGNQWERIYTANKQVIGNDPNHLVPGEVLVISPLSATPGSNYTVQAGDSLFSIAQQAYGDGNVWQVIYAANTDVITDPNTLVPGWVLYIPPVNTCVVTVASGLNIRSAPTSQSTLVTNYPTGTDLNYIEVVTGENVNGNALWGHSTQNHYYWMGGTDHPNG
jgi:LysM repeat protein